MKTAWFNGSFISHTDTAVCLRDRGLMLGDGVFETLYCRAETIEYYDNHINRLQKSLHKLAIPLKLDAEKIALTIKKLLHDNAIKEGVARITITCLLYTSPSPRDS